MSNLLTDNITYLANLGLIKGANVDTFADVMPVDPINAVALFEYSGSPAFIGDFANRSIALHVRNENYEACRALIHTIYDAYHKEKPEDRIIMLTSTRWTIIHCRSTPTKLSTDESKRTIFGFNMGILTEKDE